MSQKIPSLKPKQIIRALLRGGFIVHHQKGSHVQLRHSDKTHLRVTVPYHSKYDLPLPMIQSILKQAELTREEFLDLL